MDRGTRDAVAALDCGTNSTRLSDHGPGLDEVRLMRITRLGQGVDATGKLDPDAVARTLDVLREYRGDHGRHRRSSGPGSWPPRRCATPATGRRSSAAATERSAFRRSC